MKGLLIKTETDSDQQSLCLCDSESDGYLVLRDLAEIIWLQLGAESADSESEKESW